MLVKNDSWVEKLMEFFDEIFVDDLEVKKVIVRVVIYICEFSDNYVDSVERFLNYYFLWYKLKKSVVWIFKVKKKLFFRI